MPKRHNELFSGIATFAALHDAAMAAIRGKRSKPGAAAFMMNLENELLRLERSLNDGSWKGGAYTVIQVLQPKPRRVSAAPFRDRVVHHALCAVVAPILEKSFIADSVVDGWKIAVDF
jgi:RNA-directed DNA polymerase